MKTIMIHLVGGEDIRIECDNYHNVSKKWIFLRNNKIIKEFSIDEVHNIEDPAPLPHGFVIPRNRRS
jgi:hypothetical protein